VLNQYGITGAAPSGLPTIAARVNGSSKAIAVAAAAGQPVPRPSIEERIAVRGDFAQLKDRCHAGAGSAEAGERGVPDAPGAAWS
jgi:hypothetical protein